MWEQLAIGSGAVLVTTLIQAVFISVAVAVLQSLAGWYAIGVSAFKRVISLLCLVLWVLLGLTVAVWSWAALYIFLGVFNQFEEALYFSTVAFTTLGFGDITLSEEWRLMSGITAANGLILFSLNTAFLFEALRRIGEESQSSSMPK